VDATPENPAYSSTLQLPGEGGGCHAIGNRSDGEDTKRLIDMS
jgi:hypothetical protein